MIYAANPTIKVTVTPQKTATTTASTDEITENAPLMPQYQAVGAPASAYRALRIPKGNAIPMKNPDGNNNAADTAMRTGVEAAASSRVMNGLAKMKAASTTGRSQIHPAILPEHKLPRLDASKSTNKTTVKP